MPPPLGLAPPLPHLGSLDPPLHITTTYKWDMRLPCSCTVHHLCCTVCCEIWGLTQICDPLEITLLSTGILPPLHYSQIWGVPWRNKMYATYATRRNQFWEAFSVLSLFLLFVHIGKILQILRKGFYSVCIAQSLLWNSKNRKVGLWDKHFNGINLRIISSHM